ncbi:hypothetical protein [Arcicella aurantiaca]|nr:hypothetical protein [Arcicella aurantiaca]
MRLDNYDNEILRYIVLSRTDFREYIEHQFLEGMTWDNYCSVWEIDHIIPVGEFDMANEDDLKLCWHYLNLMPLFRKDNEIKAHSLYFAKIELEKRLNVLPSNPILKALKEKTNNEEIHAKYNYDLEFLKFYNSIKYH